MLPKLRDSLLIVLIAFLIFSLWEARQWVKHAAPKIQATLTHLEVTTATAEAITNDAKPILHKTMLHADRAVGETAAAMASIAQTSRDVRDEQKDVTQATMLVLGETAATVKSVNEQVQRIGEQSRFTLSGLESTEKSATRTLDDLDKIILDPKIQQTVSDIQGASTQFQGTMFEVHGTATDFHSYIHRLTSPVGFWKSLAKHTLGFGEKVGANLVTP